VDGLWATKSEGQQLVRAISFQDFQPVGSWSTNVTDGRTTCNLSTALCTMHRAVKKNKKLANAKESARQPWYIGHNSLNLPSRNAQQYQRHLYIVKKYFQCATIPFDDNEGLAIVVPQKCEVAQNSDKIQTYSSSRSSILVPIESAYVTSY